MGFAYKKSLGVLSMDGLLTKDEIVQKLCGYDAQVMGDEERKDLVRLLSITEKIFALVKRIRKGLVVFDACDLYSQTIILEIKKIKTISVFDLGKSKFLIATKEKLNDNYIYGPTFMEDV